MTSRQVNDFLLISHPLHLIAWDLPATIQGRGRFSVPPSTLGCRHLSQRGMEHTCINTKNDDLKPQKSGMHERHFLSIKEAILFGCWWRRPEEKNLSAFHYNRPLGSTSTFKTIMFTFFPLWAWNLRDNRLTFSLRKLLDFLYSKSHRLEMIYPALYGSISYHFIPAPWSKPVSYAYKKYSNTGYKIWRRLTSSK